MNYIFKKPFNKILCIFVNCLCTIVCANGKLHAIDKPKEFLSGQVVDSFLKEAMSLPPNERVVLITNVDFEKSNEIVINFLNAGRKKVIALKGAPGVFDEFFLDNHPKAIGVSRTDLKAVGIDMPNCGVLDPWTFQDKTEIKNKILALKQRLKLPLQALDRLEIEKFRTLGDDKMVTISDEPFIFDEGKVAYANFHILDLKVRDELKKERVVRTYQNSPIITDKVEILGLGPETLKVWGKIIRDAKAIIVIGYPKSFSHLTEIEGQKKLFVAEKDKATIAKLSDKKTWEKATSPSRP